MFELASKIADAVLYEGYLLWPYRASARKNQIRWQFGVLAPRSWCEAGGAESWWCQTECLLNPGSATQVDGRIRFLQLEHREIQAARDPEGTVFESTDSLEVDGRRYIPWDEGTPRTVDFSFDWRSGERCQAFQIEGGERIEVLTDRASRIVGRIVRRSSPAAGRIVLAGHSGPNDLLRLRVRIENETEAVDPNGPRDVVLHRSFIGVHTFLGIPGGAFLSLMDPPDDAREAAKRCENVRAYPVLAGPAGDDSVILSSPIVLYDHPEIAPESTGDMFDATEVDELLTLTTLALTDEEKAEVRATDDRAGAILDRVESLPPETWERLHGAIRGMGAKAVVTPAPGEEWLERAQAGGPQTIQVGAVQVSRGSVVRLQPGSRRSDAQDLFLVGRMGRVEAVMQDVEGVDYLAVTLEDDPAAEINRWHGRFLYFYPDEIEPLGSAQ